MRAFDLYFFKAFSRVPATGLQHTPRSSFGGQNYTPGMTSGSPSQSQNSSSYLPGYLLGGHTPASQMVYVCCLLIVCNTYSIGIVQ